MLKFITTFVTLVTVSSGYYNHGSTIISPHNSPNYYGNNAHYAPAVSSSSSVASLRSYKHITPISTHIQSNAIARTSLPTSINPLSTFHGHNINQNNNLNQHGYVQSAGEISSAAPSPAYLPPPVLSPPSISYNNNFVEPSIQNLGVKAIPSTNYATHNNAHISNLHHNQFSIPHSPISSHVSEPICRCF